MIDYGRPPRDGEVEFVVFGPGFGESIVLHLGDQHWLLVDSCLDPFSRTPAPLTYLQSIGVSSDKVRAIVASHWHDDHVRGMAEVARTCVGAEFHLSSAFNNPEALAFLAAYSGVATGRLSRGSHELFSVMNDRQNVWHAHQRSVIFEDNIQGRKTRVNAISPVQAAISQSVANFAQYLPRKGQETSIRHAVPLTPNFEAIALHVDVGGNSILLGSDLEEHGTLGWSAVAADAWCSKLPKATGYKIAHHGSQSGDSRQVWTTLLAEDPHAIVTPFNLGRHRLPTVGDQSRIKGDTLNSYLTSGASGRPKMDSRQLKRLADIAKGLKPVNNGFGAVRARRDFNNRNWTIECFGDAKHL